jgi:N-acetylmuramoyl-L-alanine amidase
VLKRGFFALILLAGMGLTANVLQHATVKGDTLLLTFAKTLNPQSIKSFRLSKSTSVRYVFDFPHTQIGSPRVPKGLHHKGVRSFRISQNRPGTVRVVIETDQSYGMSYGNRSARVCAIRLPHAQSPSRVSSLFARLSPRSQPPAKHPVHARHPKNAKSKPKAHILPSAVLPPRHHYTIILDPGHGGHDTGAIGGHRREKDAVLQIARKIRRHLTAMGFRVIMTRTSDHFVRLRNRTRYANRKHGDVFVSVHANSVGSRQKRNRHGVETFFLQTTRSGRAKRVAARENSVVLKRSDRLSKNVILNSVMTGPKIVLSNKLAIDIQRHILGNLRRKYRNVSDGGVRPAPFWVLVGAEMPAVLVETGYISNPMERKRLFTPRYQDLMAKGIAEGIANYLRNREREFE